MRTHATSFPESFWRSLKHLNDFRFFLALFFIILALFTERLNLINSHQVRAFLLVSVVYGLSAVLFAWLAKWQRIGFQRLLSLALFTDIAAITLLMHLGGGIETGIGLVLIVPIAGAGMYAETRAMLSVAILAAAAVLLEQTLQDWGQPDLAQGYARAAMLAAGLITVAGLSHFLAKGTLAATQLAGEKAQEVANLEKINSRVIQDLPYGVVVVDGAGRLLQANPQASLLLQCATPMRGSLHECLPELAALWRQWQAGDDSPMNVFETANDGRRLRARLSELDAERRAGAVIIIEDLTEIEQQATNMKLAAMGRLTANLAHEIRNPLSAISHAGQLLQEDASQDPLAAKMTRIIAENVKRLNWLVEDVLALNRRDRVSNDEVELVPFLEDFVQHFQLAEALAEGAILLDVEGAPEICFDRLHLHQIVWNLARNAARYCTGQAGSIQLRAKAAGDRVHLDVYNDGPAISPELQMRLFEPFYTTDKSGTGLGLFIARELAEANHSLLRSLPMEEGALFRLVCRRSPC